MRVATTAGASIVLACEVALAGCSGRAATGGSAGGAGTMAAAGTTGTTGAAGRAGTIGTGGATQASCPPACGPSTDDFFDNGKLATIRISFDPADTGIYTPAQWLELLRSKWNHCPPFEASDLVRVTFEYESPDGKGNVTMQDVGMRLRGGRTQVLQGFKLDFQKWLGSATGAARRRFADVNRLNTLSLESDATHMVPCLAFKAMRDFGLSASPRCNHLKVYVNGRYYGLMENVEEPDHGRFLAHHFGSTAGEIYEASPSQNDCSGAAKFADSQAKLLYSGPTFASYTSQYLISRGTTADAEAHLLPMIKCGDATQTPDDAAFKVCISEWLDVTQWLKQIAAESLIPTLESFMMQRNYLLTFVPDAAAPNGGRFLLSSWDLDSAFQKASCYPSNCDPFTSTSAFYGPAGTRATLATRLTTVFKSEYCQAMRDFLNNVYKPSLVDDMAAVIQPGMTDDPTTTMAEWQAAKDSLRSFVIAHQASALTQVNSACN